MSDEKDVYWFVLKVRFQRAMIAQTRLSNLDVEVYLPMEMRSVRVKGGNERVKPMPILSDLMFVKTTFQRISEICAAYKDLYYQSEVINGLRRAIHIPDAQMDAFKDFISGNYDNINCKITKLKSGEKIIVKSGTFKGSTVVFKEEKGKTRKEYTIEINGLDWKFSEDSLSQNILSKI